MATELKAQQEAAGKRYAAAVAEFKAARIELGAYDLAVANITSEVPVCSFSGGPDDCREAWAHPIYATDMAHDMTDAIRARADRLIKIAQREQTA